MVRLWWLKKTTDKSLGHVFGGRRKDTLEDLELWVFWEPASGLWWSDQVCWEAAKCVSRHRDAASTGHPSLLLCEVPGERCPRDAHTHKHTLVCPVQSLHGLVPGFSCFSRNRVEPTSATLPKKRGAHSAAAAGNQRWQSRWPELASFSK